MTPHIVHIINNLDAIGGAELALLRLLERRDRTRFTHEVVALLECDRLAPRLRAADVGVRALAIRRRDIGIATRALALASEARPALYVGWMYYSNLTATLLGTLRNVPVLWNVLHSLHDVARSGPGTRRSIFASEAVFGQPARIVYNSEDSARLHEARGWPRRSTQVIHTGVDATLFQPDAAHRARARAALGVPDDVLLVGRFGRHHHLKGYETLVRAFAGVRRDVPCRLLLGGRDLDATNTALVQLIESVGGADRITLIGERDDLPTLLPAFDLCVSSSHSESFPNVVTEAMAAGVPCVVTDVGDSALMVGDTGWVVRPDDVDDLRRGLDTALGEIARGPAGYPGSFGAAARARTLERFTLASTVRAFEALFEETIAQAR